MKSEWVIKISEIMDSKKLFSGKVDNYIRYRPSYPEEAIDFLYNETGIKKESVIADTGSGPGNFTVHLLKRGSNVYAVEPNDNMRETAEKTLGSYKNFHSINGSGESTGLPSQSMDFIVCAQAFHWLDRGKAKKEFKRILKEGGKVILLWNRRLTEGKEFMARYEAFLADNITNYRERATHRKVRDDDFRDFFKDGNYEKTVFPNKAMITFEEIKGLFLSLSYSPRPGDENYRLLIEKLGELFEKCKTDDRVAFYYDTNIYTGEL
ncbi:MAG: class I SAM-dependent methyltransferase [Candidatus Eremiobacterota bacterium]